MQESGAAPSKHPHVPRGHFWELFVPLFPEQRASTHSSDCETLSEELTPWQPAGLGSNTSFTHWQKSDEKDLFNHSALSPSWSYGFAASVVAVGLQHLPALQN